LLPPRQNRRTRTSLWKLKPLPDSLHCIPAVDFSKNRIKEPNEDSGGDTDYESQICNFRDIAVGCHFCDSPGSSFSQHISKRFDWRGGILDISESVRFVESGFGTGEREHARNRSFYNLGRKHDAGRSDSDSCTSDRSSYAWYRSPNSGHRSPNSGYRSSNSWNRGPNAPDCGSGSWFRHSRNYTEPNAPDYRDHHNAGNRSRDYSGNVTV
jgi:hypothetical protein